MKNVIGKFRNSRIGIQILLSTISFMFYGYSSALLDSSYKASRFPVQYYTAQTSFSGAKIKMWYQSMINAGTFDIYFKTQLIDFFFIVSAAIGGFCIWTLVANFHTRSFFFQTMGICICFCFAHGWLVRCAGEFGFIFYD
jgi:hypothetical protein